jgi:hypothetical protein
VEWKGESLYVGSCSGSLVRCRERIYILQVGLLVTQFSSLYLIAFTGPKFSSSES